MRLLRRPELLAALASVLVIVIAVGAFATFGGGADKGLPADGPQARAEVGGPAPGVLVPTLDGGLFELSGVRGRLVWINVWASWCPPCRVEFPDIDEIRRSREADGLVFLAMNFGEDLAAIESFIENTGYTFEIGLDVLREFETAYQVRGLPTHVFISADGTVASIRVGGMTPAEMEEQVEKLLTESSANASGQGLRRVGARTD
jgi:thiol-disulfide isomerase/thioredoxin